MSSASSSAPRAGGSSPRPLRGESANSTCGPGTGASNKGCIPCLVVSTDALNRSTFGIAIVCPITTTHRPAFRWRPGLTPNDPRIADSTWAAMPNWVETDQIVTLHTPERAVRHLATIIDAGKLREIDDQLRMMLNL